MKRHFMVLFFFGTLMCGSLACRSGAPTAEKTGTRIDRLVGTYPELRSGRFALIADFEDPVHFEVFEIGNASRQDRRWIVESNAQDGVLAFHAESEADELIVSNERAVNWYLKRDWRSYDLFLFAVEVPGRDLRLHAEVIAGLPNERSQAAAVWPLRRGRNVIRVDLAEVAERIPLDDVRELRFRVSGARRPVTMIFDDFILTQDRELLLGDPSLTDGSLFVLRAGRRWRVGAGGRFELTFARGQIVAWYDLAADSRRLRNLVGETVLGPELVEVIPPSAEAQASVDELVELRTWLEELNPVRAVFLVERRRQGRQGAGRPAMSTARWRYVIYPTGQVYVSIESDEGPDSAGGGMGLAVSVHEGESDSVRMVQLPFESVGSQDDDGFISGVLLRLRYTDTCLLFVPHFGEGSLEIKEHRDVDRGVVTVTARPSEALMGGAFRAVAYMRVASSTALSDDQAAEESRAFHLPVHPLPSVGGIVSNSEAQPFLEDGFDRLDGTITLVADRNLVRFAGRADSCFSCQPVFRIAESSNRAVWVYVDHQIHEPIARDEQGQAIFHLTQAQTTPALVEVLLRHPGP